MINEIDLTDISILIFKQLKEVDILQVRFFMSLERGKVSSKISNFNKTLEKSLILYALSLLSSNNRL